MILNLFRLDFVLCYCRSQKIWCFPGPVIWHNPVPCCVWTTEDSWIPTCGLGTIPKFSFPSVLPHTYPLLPFHGPKSGLCLIGSMRPLRPALCVLSSPAAVSCPSLGSSSLAPSGVQAWEQVSYILPRLWWEGWAATRESIISTNGNHQSASSQRRKGCVPPPRPPAPQPLAPHPVTPPCPELPQALALGVASVLFPDPLPAPSQASPPGRLPRRPTAGFSSRPGNIHQAVASTPFSDGSCPSTSLSEPGVCTINLLPPPCSPAAHTHLCGVQALIPRCPSKWTLLVPANDGSCY